MIVGQRTRRRLTSIAGLAVLVVLVLGPLIVGWSASAANHDSLAMLPPGAVYRVFVADWGYHTSIILEQPAGARLGPAGREEAPFVEYSWGDERFYMKNDHSASAAFAALFIPSASVTYVEGWDHAPDARAPARSLWVRDVSADGLRRLVATLEGSITREAGGDRVPPYAPADGYAGRFYPSPDSYVWTRDCNRWTVERLAAAGLARGGRTVLFSGQVPGRLTGFSPVPLASPVGR